jgi:hypothetical protein
MIFQHVQHAGIIAHLPEKGVQPFLTGQMATQIMIIDETGLPSMPEPGQSEKTVAVSSANPFWKGQESIDMAKNWFQAQFGITFIEETRVMTLYEVQKKQTIFPD